MNLMCLVLGVAFLMPPVIVAKGLPGQELFGFFDTEKTAINDHKETQVVQQDSLFTILPGVLNKFIIATPEHHDVSLIAYLACNKELLFELKDETGQNIPVTCDDRQKHLFFKDRGARYELTVLSEETFVLNIYFTKFIFVCGEDVTENEGNFILDFPAKHRSRKCRFGLYGRTEVDLKRIDQSDEPIDLTLRGGPHHNDISKSQNISINEMVSGYIWCNLGTITLLRRPGNGSRQMFRMYIRPFESDEHEKEANHLKKNRTCRH